MRAKNFFNKKNLEYTEIMIDRDPNQMKEMMSKSKKDDNSNFNMYN